MKEGSMNPKRLLPALAIVAALATGAAACGSSDDNSSSSSSGSSGSSGSNASASGTVNGAGSTFAAPVYQQFGSTLKDQGVTINYQAVGSGAGIAALAAGTAQFAGSDPALTPEDTKTLTKGDPVQIPVFFGAITASYNLSGIKSGLKLDGPTLASIFQGKVTTWNDPAIAKLNSGMKLPSSKITVIHRSDESGTTKGFTTFLSAYSKTWESKVGADKTVEWPTGTGAKGNDGVAAAIKQTDNSIGYVEQAYALANKFSYASIKNKAGSYIEPTLDSTSAAGDGVDVPDDLGISTIDAPGDSAYPITSQTFIDTYQDPCKSAGMKEGDAKALGAFLDYLLGDGQSQLEQLQYAKLPDALLSKSKEAAAKLTCNGSALTSGS
jgi:phosphate transport system substrate-binding protein